MVKRDAYRVFVGKPEGQERLARSRRRQDNIKNGYSINNIGVDWIN
jgi:hypothetical protein